jgi:hypothetical protein
MATLLDTTFADGVDGRDSYGQRWQIKVAGTWGTGDYWKLRVTCPVLGDANLGRGWLNGLVKTDLKSLFIHDDRIYLALGKQFNFCCVGDPTKWEEQSLDENDAQTAGFIPYNTSDGPMDVAVGFGTLQGRLAVFGLNSIQMWETDADPLQFKRKQVLKNIGTVAGSSIQCLGDADVYFLSLSGVRSLRALALTNNAALDDVGSPIDEYTSVAAQYVGLPSLVTSMIDPATRQFWLRIESGIYVLSTHLSSQIVAWSMASFQYKSGVNLVTFTPKKFVMMVAQGYYQLVILTTTNKLVYRTRATPGVQPVSMNTHWSDLNDPQRKVFQSIDVSVQGRWSIYANVDPTPLSVAQLVATVSSPTYSPHSFRFTGTGTHIKLYAANDTTSGDTSYKLGAFTVKYKPAGGA